jgi:hypothetical protein
MLNLYRPKMVSKYNFSIFWCLVGAKIIVNGKMIFV